MGAGRGLSLSRATRLQTSHFSVLSFIVLICDKYTAWHRVNSQQMAALSMVVLLLMMEEEMVKKAVFKENLKAVPSQIESSIC